MIAPVTMILTTRPTLLTMLLLAPLALCAGEGEPSTRQEPWVDERYQRLAEATDKLASWADGFFSQSRSVEDAAETIIRLRPGYQWDEDDGSDWRLRLTGRLYLPATSERLSVVFFGDDGDFDDEFYDPGLVSDGTSTVGVQYRLAERKGARLDLTAGIKSGPKGKLGGRYRHQTPLTPRLRLRFSEELFWIGGDGFGTLTRLDFDRRLSNRSLLRWASKAEYSEESNGVEWDTRVGYVRRLADDQAVRAFTFIRGDTDPRYLKTRGVGTSYRRSFLRPWLFWELEPRYQWRKREPGGNRDGAFSVELRIEAVLGDRELAF